MNASNMPSPPFGSTILATYKSLVTDLLGPYRPEQHYMRGPGPKWRAKNTVRHIVLRPDRSLRATPAGRVEAPI